MTTLRPRLGPTTAQRIESLAGQGLEFGFQRLAQNFVTGAGDMQLVCGEERRPRLPVRGREKCKEIQQHDIFSYRRQLLNTSIEFSKLGMFYRCFRAISRRQCT